MDPLSPPVPLRDHCSVIKDNTLYVYSPDAFQSIPLADGGRWSKHVNGVSVSGARCVSGGDSSNGDSNALWIVGGMTSDPNYSGLQKYSFATKTWTTVTPVTEVTKNRQSHVATYLQDSGSLLVYGGSQNGATIPSVETFSISIAPPHRVESYTSRNEPVSSPVLLPWNSTTAVTMGGINVSNQPNLAMYQFDMARGWHTYGRPLASNPSGDAKQNTLLHGSDGSVVLSTFDLGVSPNQVSQVLLQRPNGRPAASGESVGEPPKKRQRKDISATINNWPVYKNKLAPTDTRSGFSLAQTDNGLVAITGGGGTGSPILLFNEQRNSWVNTSNFFGTPVIPNQTILGPTSTGSPDPSSSSSPTGLPTVGDDHPKTSLILGATLGSILGFVAILIAALLLIRYKRRQKRAALNKDQDNEKQRLSFADRGDPFMMEAGGPLYRPAETAHSSVIITGAYNHRHQRNTSTRGSDSSTARLVPNNGPTLLGPHDAMEMETIEEKRTSSLKPDGNGSGPTSNLLGLPKPKRTSGWSRYFSGNEAAAVASNNNSSSEPRKSDLSSRKSLRSLKSMRSSQRASSSYATSLHDCNSHGPTEIPPLNLGQQFQGSRVSKMVTGEPNSNRNSQLPGGAARRSSDPPRPGTVESQVSTMQPSTHTADDTIFSREASENSSWTPLTSSVRHRDTATSSIYSHRRDDSDVLPSKTYSINAPAGASVVQKPANTIKAVHNSTSGQTFGNVARGSDVPNNDYKPVGGFARTSDVPIYPKQPERVTTGPERVSIIEEDDVAKTYYSPPAAAITGITVPGGTISQSTIVRKKPAVTTNDKPVNTDMSWVKLATD